MIRGYDIYKIVSCFKDMNFIEYIKNKNNTLKIEKIWFSFWVLLIAWLFIQNTHDIYILFFEIWGVLLIGMVGEKMYLERIIKNDGLSGFKKYIGSDENLSFSGGKTVLISAVRDGSSKEKIKSLIDLGLDVDEADDYGMKAIDYAKIVAQKSGNFEIVDILKKASKVHK